MLCRAALCFCMLFPIPSWGIEAVVSQKTFFLPSEDKNTQQYNPYVEVYWEINPHTVSFTQENSNWISKIKTDVIISKENKPIIERHYILQTIPTNNQTDAEAQTIMDLKRYALPYGSYSVNVTFSDPTGKTSAYSYTDSFSITPPTSAVFYSDVQLLDTVINEPRESVFAKNNQLQIPFSVNFLDEKKDLLHYYVECYGMDSIAATEHPIIQTIYVTNKNFTSSLYQLIHIDTLKTHPHVLPISGTFNISVLPSGNYYLMVLLQNKNHIKLSSANLFFQRSNKAPVVIKEATTPVMEEKFDVVDLTKTFVEKYDVTQLRAIMKMLIPISTPLEVENIKGFLKKPDETYMRYFVYNFWKTRDNKKPKQAWENYAATVLAVNKTFGNSSVPGYETERGAVYLKYGPPSDRIVVNNETGAVPYEIWVYNSIAKQSNGLFLFYQSGYMINDYKILTSTVIGETRNPQWRSSLYTNGSGTSNLNSKAEEYFSKK